MYDRFSVFYNDNYFDHTYPHKSLKLSCTVEQDIEIQKCI